MPLSRRCFHLATLRQVLQARAGRSHFLLSLSMVLATGCGDPVEPVPESSVIVPSPVASVSFAGATVLVDRADYSPGDTVTVSGSGWQPGETVLLEFVKDSLVELTETLFAVADTTGGILNREFLIENQDLGAKFTLTALGTSSNSTAQTTFTDSHIIYELHPQSGPAAGGYQVRIRGAFRTSGFFTTIRNEVLWDGVVIPSTWLGPVYYPEYPSFPSGFTTIAVTAPAHASGPVNVVVREVRCSFGSCSSHNSSTTAVFTYEGAAVTHLAITPASLTAQVGQCAPAQGPSTVETRNAQGPVAVTSNLIVTLTTSSVKGSFYSDPACSSELPKDGTGKWLITIPSGASAATFWYQDRLVGTATITAAAPSPITGASQQVTVSPAATMVALTAPATAGYGQADLQLTAEVTAQAPGTGPVDEGTVLFTLNDATHFPMQSVGPVAVNGSGVATATLSLPESIIPDSYEIEAVYRPAAVNPGFKTSATTKAFTVRRATTATALTSVSPGGTSFVNGPVSVGVNVTPEFNSTPFGTVLVTNGAGGPTLCTVTLSSRAGSCSFTPATVGALSLVARYTGTSNHQPSDSPVRSHWVTYNFSGLTAPVDLTPTLNVVKAGQAIPLKWRLVDAENRPVTSLAAVSVTVAGLSCGIGATDLVEELASGASGLQNLGDGYYQFNWKSATSYGGSCKQVRMDLGEGTLRQEVAYFSFRK